MDTAVPPSQAAVAGATTDARPVPILGEHYQRWLAGLFD